MTRVIHLVVGPQRHGVVRFGRALYDAMARVQAGSSLRQYRQFDEIDFAADGSGVHVQFTDRVFGRTPEEAARAVSAIVAAAERAGGRVTATLHDLPQPSDGRNYPRRLAAYAHVCARVHAVVVSSEHEFELLKPYAPHRTAVVPLPIAALPHKDPVAAQSLSIAVFGFVYPGKGHLEVLAAIAHMAENIELIAIGAASPGHDDLVADLTRHAHASQVRFRLTGHVPDGAVAAMLRGVTIPIAPHRHVSASGSINSWLAAGRRPLAPVNRYTEEIMLRNPDALELYPDTEVGLRTAIKRAVDEPLLTWLPQATVLTPSPDQAAAQYARLLTQWHR